MITSPIRLIVLYPLNVVKQYGRAHISIKACIRIGTHHIVYCKLALEQASHANTQYTTARLEHVAYKYSKPKGLIARPPSVLSKITDTS